MDAHARRGCGWIIAAEALEARRTLNGDDLVIDGTTLGDTIDLRQEFDELIITVNGQARTVAASQHSSFVIRAGKGNDTIILDASVTVGFAIDGGPGHDHLVGGSGDDSLDGGSGRDTLDGGGGGNRVEYNGRKSGVVIRLDGSGFSGRPRERDQIRNIENATGGTGPDRIYGTSGPNLLDGSTGRDSLYGGDGNDTLLGGPGGDRLDGGPGADQLIGGAGDDRLFGQDWAISDALDGGPGNNRAYADRQWVTPWGGIGSLFGHYEQDAITAVRYTSFRTFVGPG